MTKRDKIGQKGTILFCQFHLVRKNKSGQKGTKKDKTGQFYSVNFLLRRKKSGQKGTKDDKKGQFCLVMFLIRSKKNRDIKVQKGTILFFQFHLLCTNKSGQKGT